MWRNRMMDGRVNVASASTRSEISVFGNEDAVLGGRQLEQLGVIGPLQATVTDGGSVMAGRNKPQRELGRQRIVDEKSQALSTSGS